MKMCRNNNDLEKVSSKESKTNDRRVRLARRLWISCVLLMAPTKDGLAPFFSSYLVASVGMSAGSAGLVWFIRDIAKMASQIPLGNLVDKTTNKRAILLLSIFVLTFMPMSVIFTQNFTFIIFKSILEGIGASGLEASKGPFTLGLTRGDHNFDTMAKYVEAMDHIGSLIAAVSAGTVAYIMYPNVALLFVVIGVMGALAFLAIAIMPLRTSSRNKSEIFNHDIARNAVITKRNPGFTKGEDVEKINSELQENKNSKEDTDISSEESIEVVPSISIRELLSDRNLLYFAIAIFFFHLGNAAILPLLSQVLALEGGRAGIPYTGANISVTQIVSVFAAYGMDYLLKNKDCKINVPVIIGFGSLVPRVGSIIFLLQVWPNEYALIATQLFDGIGAGVNGLAIMTVTQLLTEGTGRYGFAVSVMRCAHFAGGALSNLLTGYLVSLTGSYESGFGMCGVAAIMSIFFVSRMVVPSRESFFTGTEKTEIHELEVTVGGEEQVQSLEKGS